VFKLKTRRGILAPLLPGVGAGHGGRGKEEYKEIYKWIPGKMGEEDKVMPR
jgi:hypothetical protein